MNPFRDDMTLSEARELLRTLVEEGHECPVCRRLAKIHKRTIHTSMASGLVKLYRVSGGDTSRYIEIADHMEHRELADFAKLAYWDLVVPEFGVRDDGSKRVGRWRITAKGIAFVLGRSKVARCYAKRCLALVGEPISIQDALGQNFNYGELMADLPEPDRGEPAMALFETETPKRASMYDPDQQF
jgi:hypothetical protein